MILYCSTSNPGKLREFLRARDQAGEADLKIEALPGLAAIAPPEESGASFEENAAIKAAYYSRLTGEYVFADDSGLVVDALDGAPGIYSARYAGEQASDEDNNRLVLARLHGRSKRSARFVCAIAVAQAGRVLNVFRGTVEGEILTEERGLNGFGYDPLFFYPPLGRSFGELANQEKFAVSHRGNALRALFAWIANQRTATPPGRLN